MAVSKFFRAFVEGQTISDGRKIEAAWIDQIVETFNTETYTPRINIEHISGYSPEPPFNGYGNVVAVKAQTDDLTVAGKAGKFRALYLQVDDNGQLAALVEKGQKPFPSVELTDSYAGSGKVGLIGLAFTDNPASIATQALKFSRSAPGSIFADPGDAVAIEFEAAQIEPTGIADAIKTGFASFAAMFTAKETEKKEEPKPPANDNFDPAKFAIGIGEQLAAALAPVVAAQAKFGTDFAALQAKLEKTPEGGSFTRHPATGSVTAGNATDC